MALFKKKRKKRVLVIGLDGVPFPLIQDMAKKDIMPTMGKLIESGNLHKMKASLPEISSVSWTDFMTGKNSGSHGIFGFTDFKKGTYDLRFPNFNDVKCDTFWDTLAQQKKRSIIINQPSTYPARKINGTLISGFVALELAKAVFPMPYKNTLETIGYQIDIDTLKSREDHNFLWSELKTTLEGRVKAFNSLWKEDWDFFEIVITGTDRLHHFLWNAYEDENHMFHQKFMDYYREVDSVIEKAVSAFSRINGDLDGLYLLSDHGFTGIKQEVYLNAWLEKNNYLSFTSSEPSNLKEISSDSIAFAMDPNRIYLNLKSKFPNASVEETDKAKLKAEITEKIKKLDYNGNNIVKEVFDCEKVYEGPYVPDGPDLIVISEHGFDMKGSVKKKEIFGRSNLQGMHTWDEAFFWALKDHGQDLSISNLSNIIMENFK